MFESGFAEVPLTGSGTVDEACFDETRFDEPRFDETWDGWVPDPDEVDQVPPSQRIPSGWSALELDHGTADAVALTDADLIEGIVGLERVTSWAQARQARLLAEFARRRPPDAWQARRSDTPSRCSSFAADEVGLALRLSRTAAADRLALGSRVVEKLPETLAARGTGLIDTPKVRAIAEATELLPERVWPALEERVLPRARQQTVAQLRRSLLRAVLALDPDGAERRHQQRRQDRRVVVTPDGDGMSTLWALLSAPDAAASYEWLGRLARASGADDPRGMDARRADLLVELLTGRRCGASGCVVECDGSCEPGRPVDEGGGVADACSADAGGADAGSAPLGDADAGSAPLGDVPGPDAPGAGAPGARRCECGVPGGGRRAQGSSAGRPGRPLVQVIVPITMLMGLDEQPGELVGYGPIPASLAREIAAEGTWRRLLTDPESGTLLDHGRATYTPPAGLADFVRARDVYCRSPICGQPAARADLDHTVSWDDGGETREKNLYAGCRHDHLAKTHVPGWRVVQRDDARITWITPTGHSYTSRPHDYRPDPHAPPDPAADPSADGDRSPGADPGVTADPAADPPPF